MINRSSALITNYKIGSIKVNQKIKLIFREIKDLDIKQIAAWPATLEIIDLKLSKIINSIQAPGFNKSLSSDNIHLLRMEPLKWWLIDGQDFNIPADEGSIIDLSHAFTSIEIKGDDIIKFLNRHLPLDLRDQSFPINSIASSAIHHVSVKIWRTNQSYILFIPRGFALSIWEILLETAFQFGYEII